MGTQEQGHLRLLALKSPPPPAVSAPWSGTFMTVMSQVSHDTQDLK